MPIDPAPVKYILIVNAIQHRITTGAYPVGSKVPSEADLVREFGASRSTVVRALQLLRQQGWLEGQQGIGRVVVGRPSTTRRIPKLLRSFFAAEDPTTITVLSAGLVPAPERAAAALGVEPGTVVVGRRRLLTVASLGPVEITTVYARRELAAVAALAGPDPIADDLLRYVAGRGGPVGDHLAVRISARPPEPDETAVLKVGRRECLTSVLVSVLDQASRPVLAIDAAVATRRRPLDVAFPA
jgi:GntR family transcriptional regulator